MKNAALAQALESDLIAPLRTPGLRGVTQPRVIVPVPAPSVQPRGLWHSLWLRLFGPPPRDPRAAASDLGVFRALHEVGSDYLPSSGTWPASRGFE